MKARIDYLTDDTGDLLFRNGDIVQGDSDQQHVADTINANVGWWKEYPNDGVQIADYSASPGDGAKLSRKIKIELEKDGYKVSNPVLQFDTAGQLKIYPNASL